MDYYIKFFQNYATFSGRARRSELWVFYLFNIVISLVLSLVAVEIIYSLYNLAVIIPSIAVGVRRMHDVGKNGWFLLIPIYSLILAFTEGDKGDNQYGSDPKAI